MQHLLMILILMMASAHARADDNQSPTGTAGLLCQMSRHGVTSAETLSVDYDQKQVNGIPATFTTSMIVWTIRRGTGDEHHELNRLTGTYNYWTDGKSGTEPMPTFVCVKAPMKF